MEQSQLDNILKKPSLKKIVIRRTILVMINIHHDFPIHQLMENSKFKLISEGDCNLEKNGKIIHEKVNFQFIEVVKELIDEGLTKFNQYDWLVTGKKFKRKYYEEIEEDFGLEFIGKSDV